MSETKRTSASAPESSSQSREWPEASFRLLYLAIVINTAVTIFLLWLFSATFD